MYNIDTRAYKNIPAKDEEGPLVLYSHILLTELTCQVLIEGSLTSHFLKCQMTSGLR